MNKIYVIYLVIISAILCSCKESVSDKIAKLVNEWENKEIIFPKRMYFTVLGQDTISTYPQLNSNYSVVTYVDSVGCTSCKLQLKKWKEFITELDSLTSATVPVLFLFVS